MFRLAEQQDLAKIVEIYNQNIESKKVTADLTAVSVKDRQAWFDFHVKHWAKYPLWVVEQDGQVNAWCSYSVFYGRQAYEETTEISFYIDKNCQGQGLGHKIIQFLISQMPHYQITTLLAFVFEENHKSVALLHNYGFKQLGVLPNVANMQTGYQSLVILGYQ